jgi:hypothetical protein
MVVELLIGNIHSAHMSTKKSKEEGHAQELLFRSLNDAIQTMELKSLGTSELSESVKGIGANQTLYERLHRIPCFMLVLFLARRFCWVSQPGGFI